MAEIVVAYAPEDEARGDAVVAALRRSGVPARPPAGEDQASLVLWSRHAARRRLGRAAARAALIARLDETPPPPGLRAYRAVDLRAWRGALAQPAWRSLVRMLAVQDAPPAPASAPAAAADEAPMAASTAPLAPAPAPTPKPRSPAALWLLLAIAALLAAAAALLR